MLLKKRICIIDVDKCEGNTITKHFYVTFFITKVLKLWVNIHLTQMFYRLAMPATQNSITIVLLLWSIHLSHPASGLRKTMKLGAVPNLSFLFD